jgi:hypothetical protein
LDLVLASSVPLVLYLPLGLVPDFRLSVHTRISRTEVFLDFGILVKGCCHLMKTIDIGTLNPHKP